METKNFLGIYGLKRFWEKAKLWIINEITTKIAEIVAEAPESFDTLKEISDWITEHVGSAAEMNTKIIQNQNDIKALQSLVGNIADYVPVGTILQGLYAAAPTGFLLCNGQEVAIENFPKLYAVIGTLEKCQSKNEGMFKLPDLRECVLVGIGTNSTNSIASHDTYSLGQFKDDQIQNITGSIGVAIGMEDNATGAFYNNGLAGISKTTGASLEREIYTSTKVFAASRVARTDNTNTTHGKQFGVNYIIKY